MVIESIAARAELRIEQVPQLALVMEGAVREIEAWRHGDGLWAWMQNQWRRRFESFQKMIITAALVLIGMSLFKNSGYSRDLAWLCLCLVLVNLNTLHT